MEIKTINNSHNIDDLERLRSVCDQFRKEIYEIRSNILSFQEFIDSLR